MILKTYYYISLKSESRDQVFHVWASPTDCNRKYRPALCHSHFITTGVLAHWSWEAGHAAQVCAVVQYFKSLLKDRFNEDWVFIKKYRSNFTLC